jgi:demethylmenaquinone methyltransferase / 2-methoxy-6-polyprenyl-1,4-benzoquinol methylase
MSIEKKTHFGYQEVPWNKKQGKVNAVFDAVASRYDIMNDLMSMGLHRLWKQFTLCASHVRPGQSVLDLAGGSGDLTRLLAKQVGTKGQVVLADINESMLQCGRRRLIDAGILAPVVYTLANAECLPFEDNTFDCITIGFGLRNVRDKDAALRSMFRVLKPGGRLMVLEFSKPKDFLEPLYQVYLFTVLPFLGKIIAQDEESYRYLAESIRMHPDAETLKKMITEAGFEDCHYHRLTAGIVALHIAFKY